MGGREEGERERREREAYAKNAAVYMSGALLPIFSSLVCYICYLFLLLSHHTSRHSTVTISSPLTISADLLSFEKLESGILELHRQDIPALQFISECIVLFNPQAREKGVSLDLLLTVDDATLAAYPGAVPLFYSDKFSCDRFKLEQVVRTA